MQHIPTRRVLVVDDSPTDLALMASALEHAGYDVSSTTDEEVAYQTAVRDRPDCVILDVVLRGRGGFALCRRLKQSLASQAIPVILVSVKHTEADRLWGLQQGAADYLVKPFTAEDLLASVQRVL
jgi:twitching motility two-component system response regulator PilH